MTDWAEVVAESELWHARVRAFADAPADFDDLALRIADFQARTSPGFRRLWEAAGGAARADGIPAVPSDAFRLTRVAVHPPELDAVCFVTSGTTAEARGTHPLRTTRTYEHLCLAGAARGLVPDPGKRRVVVALAPDPGEPGESSLGYMMRLFMRHFDGRERPSWLLGASGVDLDGLRAATATGEPLLVLATSFALVALLDALDGATLSAAAGSVVMQTGGFKGKSRELDPAELRAGVARAFGIDEASIVGEYGMTELSSQLYESEPGVYAPPPWLRVTPVDPVSLEAVAPGETGLARFVDLGNVDSAIAVVTQDLVRLRPGGVELLGRRRGAPPRGCSLAIEALVAG